MDKKVYVLVPVYNVEKVVRDCLDSVINQTYKNWEMIIVDDGSTDKSGKICDKYAEKDKRIRVIHQKNKGSSEARLRAVREMTDMNSYCMFSDSDDIMPSNAINTLVKIAEKHSCDIVSGNAQKFFSIKKPDASVNSNTLTDIKIHNRESIRNNLLVCFFGYGGFSVTLWGKLYRTEFFKNIVLNIKEWPHYFGDDLNATIRLVANANSIAETNCNVYFYRYGGGTNKFMKSYITDCLILYKTKKEHAEKYNVAPYYKSLIEVEMKNLAMQYLVMCIRSKTYPHGKIEDEIRYILEIPEFYNATCSITQETLSRDYSESPGFTQAFVRKDIAEIKRIATEKANQDRIKRFIKNLL